jgi:hypothetical protein
MGWYPVAVVILRVYRMWHWLGSRWTFYKKWHSRISTVPWSKRSFYKKWHSKIAQFPGVGGRSTRSDKISTRSDIRKSAQFPVVRGRSTRSDIRKSAVPWSRRTFYKKWHWRISTRSDIRKSAQFPVERGRSTRSDIRVSAHFAVVRGRSTRSDIKESAQEVTFENQHSSL